LCQIKSSKRFRVSAKNRNAGDPVPWQVIHRNRGGAAAPPQKIVRAVLSL
jgi:hypothetical protein